MYPTFIFPAGLFSSFLFMSWNDSEVLVQATYYVVLLCLPLEIDRCFEWELTFFKNGN